MRKIDQLQKKQLILLHGDDEQSLEEILHHQILPLPSADPTTAGLNTVTLDGMRASQSELESAVLSMPFLAEKKLIVLKQPAAFFKTKERQTAMLSLLENLPPYVIIAIIWLDEGKNRKIQGQWQFTWNTLNEKHWLARWINEHPDQTAWISMALPAQEMLPQWLMKKAEEKGGKLSSAGAYALAQAVGNDTRTLMLELEKALLFVNGQREISQEDVHLLTSQQQQSNVFDLMDALSNQRYELAFGLLHKILADEDAMRVFAMLIRQLRLLIQANEVLAEGGKEDDIARELKQHPFVAKKLAQQARNFPIGQLKRGYQQLQQDDAAIKVGKIQPELAMELFISSLLES